MTSISEKQLEIIKTHMVHDSDVLDIKFRAKNNRFDIISVFNGEVDDYLKKGYVVKKSMVRKTTMCKEKANGVQFEDDIWCMFYNLGFKILNRDENLSVQWGPNETDIQQLDVVAVGDDSIFVVECKAAAQSVSHSFKNELNKMEQYMRGVSDSLRHVYGLEKRVKFIFATRNYRFPEEGEDIKRMRNYGIFHLNDNTYKYITSLIKCYKNAAIYQFLGLMFKDELINDKPITIPALKGKMGKQSYFLFSIEPSILLKVGFVLHRTKVNDSLAPTYQRLLVPSRLKGITKFIDDGGFFPNSIILNFCEPSDDVKIKFDMIHKEEDSEAEFGLLSIPNAYGIAYIIDGQHRVYGYANSKYKDKHTVPVVAFENMPSEEQLQIFMDINENQKAVNPSLRLDLQEDLCWKSSHLDSRMKALRSSVIKALGNNSNNVLYGMISIGEDSATLAFKPFDTALSRSGLLPKATATRWTGNLDTCLYDINETNNEKAMREARKNIACFVDGAYSIANNAMNEETRKVFLFTPRATYAFITLIGSVHRFLIQTGVICSSSSISERLEAIKPYIIGLSENLNGITDDEKRTITGVLGQGADVFWLRSYQNFVNKDFPNYCPDELAEWKETQDEDLQLEGNNIKKDICGQVKRLVFERLVMVYGDKWDKSVALLKNVTENKILKMFGDDDSFDPNNYDWRDYLEIMDYKTIIKENFSNDTFSQVFAIDLGLGFKSKNDKIAWIDRLIDKKKGTSMTRSDINYLERINTYLQQFISE